MDIIFIVTPPEIHLKMVTDALTTTTKHVICDKPPTLNLNEMKLMYNLSLVILEIIQFNIFSSSRNIQVKFV